MGKIIAVANQKGGVGKTTTTVNLANSVAMKNKTVLIVDTDPQGNATTSVGIKKSEIDKSTYDLLTGRSKPTEVVSQTDFKNLYLVPCNIDLAGAEIELYETKDRLNCLRKGLVMIKNNFDYIFIDCPPSLSLLTLNAFSACDTILIPMQCEYFALEGLSELTSTIKKVRQTNNPNIDIEGIAFTMYDGRNAQTGQVVAEVKRYFKDKVYKTSIPRAIRLSEAPSHGKPIAYYEKSSKGAVAYKDLATEFLKRNNDK